jgi:hypothetical protein
MEAAMAKLVQERAKKYEQDRAVSAGRVQAKAVKPTVR